MQIWEKYKPVGSLIRTKGVICLIAGLFLTLLVSQHLSAQKLEFSYSYVNITRGVGGGTLEQGDIIEVRALVKVNATTSNFYYIDTVRTGTQYISTSLKIVTNEGLTYQGSFTNAPLMIKEFTQQAAA